MRTRCLGGIASYPTASVFPLISCSITYKQCILLIMFIPIHNVQSSHRTSLHGEKRGAAIEVRSNTQDLTF